jgi:hypothetical protein
VPRRTILNLPPPLPPPDSDEARLMAVALRPDAREPIETPPSPSLHAMARRALDDSQGDIIHCYERLLLGQPTATGGLEVQLDLASNGAVTRVLLDQDGAHDLDGMLPCLEGVLREVRVRDVAPRGQYISRLYSFASPTIDRVVAAPVVVLAAPAPGRGRARRGASGRPTTPPVLPWAPAPVPAPAPGSVRADELTLALTDTPALRACAPVASRRGRTVAPLGAMTLHMTVGPTGRVSEAALEGAPPPVATCVAAFAQALRFRESGITVRATMTVRFGR